MASQRLDTNRAMAMPAHAWATRLIACAALLASASVASAETLMMPDRDALMGTLSPATNRVVVWGVTTQANGTAFTLDYGDGSAPTTGTVTDRSYIAFNHIYTTSGIFTATLTVGTGAGAEMDTVEVQVFDAASLTAANLRGVRICTVATLLPASPSLAT